MPLIFQKPSQQYRSNGARGFRTVVQMPFNRSTSFRQSNRARLCWSDPPNSPVQEEFVSILESHPMEALISSTLRVSEETKVTLIGKDYTGIGIVKSCRRDGENFILSIGLTAKSAQTTLPPGADPGALVVDDFLTEEQETKILESLEDSYRSWFRVPMLLWSSLLFVLTCC